MIKGQNYPGSDRERARRVAQDRARNIRTPSHDRRNIAVPWGPRKWPPTKSVSKMPSVISPEPGPSRSMHGQGGLLGFFRTRVPNLFGQSNLPARNRPAPRSKGITAKTAAGSARGPNCIALDSPAVPSGGNKVLMSVSNDGSGKMIRTDTRPAPPPGAPVKDAIEEYVGWISNGGIRRAAGSLRTRLQRAQAAFRSG